MDSAVASNEAARRGAFRLWLRVFYGLPVFVADHAGSQPTRLLHPAGNRPSGQFEEFSTRHYPWRFLEGNFPIASIIWTIAFAPSGVSSHKFFTLDCTRAHDESLSETEAVGSGKATPRTLQICTTLKLNVLNWPLQILPTWL